MSFLTDEWDWLGGLWHFLGDSQHEDREGEEHSDPESHFLSGIRRETEDEEREAREHHAGKNNIIDVVSKGRGADPRVERKINKLVLGRVGMGKKVGV